MEEDKAQHTAMRISMRQKWSTAKRTGTSGTTWSLHSADQTAANKGFAFILSPLLTSEILRMLVCMQVVFHTSVSPCLNRWFVQSTGTVLTGAMFMMDHAVSCNTSCAVFPPTLLLAKTSLSSVKHSQKVIQELTGFWKGFCVTLNTAIQTE